MKVTALKYPPILLQGGVVKAKDPIHPEGSQAL